MEDRQGLYWLWGDTAGVVLDLRVGEQPLGRLGSTLVMGGASWTSDGNVVAGGGASWGGGGDLGDDGF